MIPSLILELRELGARARIAEVRYQTAPPAERERLRSQMVIAKARLAQTAARLTGKEVGLPE